MEDISLSLQIFCFVDNEIKLSRKCGIYQKRKDDEYVISKNDANTYVI